MKPTRTIAIVIGIGALLVGGPAMAQQDPHDERGERKTFLGQYGIELSAGGGVLGFTDDETRNFTDVGGSWEARVGFDTPWPFTMEAAYVGGAQAMEAIGLDNDAFLLGTGLETNARFDFATRYVTPYVLAGVGWKHYDISNADFNTSNMQDNEDALEIPLGAGINYEFQRILIDLRGTYRAAFYDDLMRHGENFDSDASARLSNWQASLRAGYRF